ncbi:hypothetical protein Dester_0436 [Desulfurobacterium thermolithotrophum DSM 11699]|uniref:TMEM205-like domain-containing protein n=1 Tax=Desulfurobacterium thermolithotrophum (strain DSM 11699 / BSA) TaxID=868864 RepID=F0S2L8_DESTD|nr:DUF4149 domain-containing protein [Desulfurobacterium thermolithotrophum]ADY73090.1 hypothetical protein Dester_0436 [Desulfurobacterium thermolithotrophum DSM 11699]
MFFFLKSLYLYCVALWVGSMFFFTVIGAPAAFKIFKKEEAGKYTGFIFPKYFVLGNLFGLLALVSFYILVKESMTIVAWLNLLFLLVMNMSNFINGFFITPRANSLKMEYYRTRDESYYNSFLKLHGVSMALNGLNLLLGFMIIGITSLYLTF